MRVTKAIIPCGGFGTRFLPATKVMPKELLPIVDKPALSYIVEEAVKSGITDILIVISQGKESIKRLFEPNQRLNAHLLKRGQEDFFNLANQDFGANVSFVYQEEQKGSGDAIYLGKEFSAGEPVAVLFGDDVIYTGNGDPVTKQLIDAFASTCKTVIGVQRTNEEIARRCGVMILDGAASKITPIKGIIEKPKNELPSDLVSLGRFILTPDVFDALERAKAGVDGEIYLTDALSAVASRGGAVACTFDGRRYDIGNKQGYLEAVVEFALRDKELSRGFAEFLAKRV